jgi:hypothetical protein
MLRYVAIFGMGALFLLISPHLRTEMSTGFGNGVKTMDANAPYSYIGLGVLILVFFLFSLTRGVRPR